MEHSELLLGMTFLTGCGIMDIKHKTISKVWLALFFMAGIILNIYKRQPLFMVTGIIPGIVLYILTLLTKGRIGRGDAATVLVLGLYLGMWGGFTVLLLGSALTSLWGLFMLLAKRRSMKKEVAFTPFILAGLLIYIVVGGGLWT